MIIGLIVICIGFYVAERALPVLAQPGGDHPVRRADRHHRARHRAGAAARRDRPVGRLGQRPGRRRDGGADGQPGPVHRSSADRRRARRRRGRVCSTGCSTPRSACRASCSRWPGCSASWACCSSCSATNGTINLPRDSSLLEFARFSFVTGVASYALVALVVLAYLGAQCAARPPARKAAELAPPWWPLVLAKAVLLAVGLGFLTYYLNIDRGFSYLLVAVRGAGRGDGLRAARARVWGRHVFAVGGNVEAARRSGIKVNRIYISVFVLTLAARRPRRHARRRAAHHRLAGHRQHRHQPDRHRGGRHRRHQPLRRSRLGVLRAARASSCSRRSPAGSTSPGSSPRCASWSPARVLLLAVAIDSVSRRARSSSGRG